MEKIGGFVFALYAIAFVVEFFLRKKQPTNANKIRQVGATILATLLIGITMLMQFELLAPNRGQAMAMPIILTMMVLILMIPVFFLLGILSYRHTYNRFKYLVLFVQMVVLGRWLRWEYLFHRAFENKEFNISHGLDGWYETDIVNVIVVLLIMGALLLWFFVLKRVQHDITETSSA